MATIVNARDVLLQNAAVRTPENPVPMTPSKALTLIASRQNFVVENGVPNKASIQLTAHRSALTGQVSWQVLEGAGVLSVSGDSAVLDFSKMTTETIRVRASIVESAGGGNWQTPENVRPVGHENTPFTLTFADEFRGTDLDRSKWNTTFYSDAEPALKNWSVLNGCLNIWPDTGFVNRTIDTDGKFSQLHGYWEIRAKLPRGKGTLPTFWGFTHAPDTDRPQVDILKARPSGDAVVIAPDPGNTVGDIGIGVWGDQQLFEDGNTAAESGIPVAKPQTTTFDEGIDAAYVVTNHGDLWQNIHPLRVDGLGWADKMANSTDKIIIISAGVGDYYGGRTLAQFEADLRFLITTARNAATPKFVIYNTNSLTQDSSWWPHKDRAIAVCQSMSVPVIDVFTYTQNYCAQNNIKTTQFAPNATSPTQTYHTLIGNYVATRFNEIKATNPAGFPTPSVGGGTVPGGGNWGTNTFVPVDYLGRVFDKTTQLVGQRRMSDLDNKFYDLSARFHYYGMKWEPDGVTFYFDGRQMSTKIPTNQLKDYPLYPVLSLWFETDPVLAPDATNTPVGPTNAYQIDYIRCWALNNATNPAPSQPTPPPPAPAPSPTPVPGPPAGSNVRPYGDHAGKNWPLVFRDEFDGSSLNRSIWNDAVWYGDNSGVAHTQQNYSVANSCLNIWPYRGPGGRYMNRTIDTDGKYYQKFGYFEARMKLNNGRGCWPAFWLFGHYGNMRPEIDIMEAYPGGTNGVWGSNRYPFKPTSYAGTIWRTEGDQVGQKVHWTPNTMLDEGFHIYACLWEADGITFLFDGRPIREKFYTTAFNQWSGLYLMFDLWFGSASGTPNTAETPEGPGNSFSIDYIRCWALDGAPRTMSSQVAHTETVAMSAEVDTTFAATAATNTPGPSGATGDAEDFNITTFYDEITIVKAFKGTTLRRAYLTNQHHIVLADAAGKPNNLASAATHMVIYEGSEDVTQTYTFTQNNGPGVTSVMARNALTVTSMANDSGYIDINAHKPGQPVITRRMTLMKSRPTTAN